MPWTETARREYRRDAPRYASDTTDCEWALIEPFMPPPKPLGRPRTTDLREVVNAILYIATTGCQWAMPPKDLPPVLDRSAPLPRLARQRAAARDPLLARHGDP